MSTSLTLTCHLKRHSPDRLACRVGKAEMTKMLKTWRRIAVLEEELAVRRQELREQVVAAHDSGESVSEIARRLGVTRSRVYQLLGH